MGEIPIKRFVCRRWSSSHVSGSLSPWAALARSTHITPDIPPATNGRAVYALAGGDRRGVGSTWNP